MMTRVVHPSGVTYVRICDLPRCGEFVSHLPVVVARNMYRNVNSLNATVVYVSFIFPSFFLTDFLPSFLSEFLSLYRFLLLLIFLIFFIFIIYLLFISPFFLFLSYSFHFPFISSLNSLFFIFSLRVSLLSDVYLIAFPQKKSCVT
jgi:hypothetical protein